MDQSIVQILAVSQLSSDLGNFHYLCSGENFLGSIFDLRGRQFIDLSGGQHAQYLLYIACVIYIYI